MVPSVEAVSGMITGSLIDHSQAIEVHNSFRAPDGTETEMSYRLDKTPPGLQITGTVGGHPIEESVDTRTFRYRVLGRIGESVERLDIFPVMGGFRHVGQVGDVPVHQDIALLPWQQAFRITAHFGPALMALLVAPSPGGTYSIEGHLDGRPVTGSIGPGDTPGSIRIERQVAGYQIVSEILPIGLQPPEPPPDGESPAGTP